MRLLKKSNVGYAELAQVDEVDAKDLKGPEHLTDPETGIDESAHPLDMADFRHLSPEKLKQAQEMLTRRSLAMARNDEDMGLTDWIEHKIEIKPGCEEPAAEPQRSYPPEKRKLIFEVVEDLLEKDLIEEATSAWRTFPVLARKRNPETG